MSSFWHLITREVLELAAWYRSKSITNQLGTLENGPMQKLHPEYLVPPWSRAYKYLKMPKVRICIEKFEHWNPNWLFLISIINSEQSQDSKTNLTLAKFNVPSEWQGAQSGPLPPRLDNKFSQNLTSFGI